MGKPTKRNHMELTVKDINDKLRYFALQRHQCEIEELPELPCTHHKIHVSDIPSFVISNLEDRRFITPEFKDWFYKMINDEEECRWEEFTPWLSNYEVYHRRIKREAYVKVGSNNQRQFKADDYTVILFLPDGTGYFKLSHLLGHITSRITNFELKRTIMRLSKEFGTHWFPMTGDFLEVLQRKVFATNPKVRTTEGEVIVLNLPNAWEYPNMFNDMKLKYYRGLLSAVDGFISTVEDKIDNLTTQINRNIKIINKGNGTLILCNSDRQYSTYRSCLNEVDRACERLINDIGYIWDIPIGDKLSTIRKQSDHIFSKAYGVTVYNFWVKRALMREYEYTHLACPLEDEPLTLKEKIFGRSTPSVTREWGCFPDTHQNDEMIRLHEFWKHYKGVIFNHPANDHTILKMVFAILKRDHGVIYDTVDLTKAVVSIYKYFRYTKYAREEISILYNQPEKFGTFLLELSYALDNNLGYNKTVMVLDLAKKYINMEGNDTIEAAKLLLAEDIVKKEIKQQLTNSES